MEHLPYLLPPIRCWQESAGLCYVRLWRSEAPVRFSIPLVGRSFILRLFSAPPCTLLKYHQHWLHPLFIGVSYLWHLNLFMAGYLFLASFFTSTIATLWWALLSGTIHDDFFQSWKRIHFKLSQCLVCILLFLPNDRVNLLKWHPISPGWKIKIIMGLSMLLALDTLYIICAFMMRVCEWELLFGYLGLALGQSLG